MHSIVIGVLECHRVLRPKQCVGEWAFDIMKRRSVARVGEVLLPCALLAACSGVPGFSPDWRLAACFAEQPGVVLLETFEVDQVSDLFPRMNAWDRGRIGPGTDERPAFVARLRGKLKVMQPAVGPFGDRSFEIDDPTCLIVRNADGTYAKGETPLFLGPLGGG